MTPKTIALCLSALLCWALQPVQGGEVTPATLKASYKSYLELYSSDGHDEQFYALSADLKHYYQERQMTDEYYTTALNEVLYAIDHGHASQAMSKARELLGDMQLAGYPHYGRVYAAMGNLYESRGMRRMAERYYLEAIDNTDPRDEAVIIGMYSQMASLKMLDDPYRARKWNARYAESSQRFPHYRLLYLFIQTLSAFALNQPDSCLRAAAAYRSYQQAHASQLDDFGATAVQCVTLASQKHYDRALRLLDRPDTNLDTISIDRLRVLICRAAGRYEQAMAYAQRNADRIDSLCADLYTSNIDQLEADTDMARLQARSHERTMLFFGAVLALAAIVIVLLAVHSFLRHRGRKLLNEKNRQLQAALSMAEESDRMKTEFVRSVSHEIRTPLNAINGFNEIINNREIELTDDERNDLIGRIRDNVKSITSIVDEMLHMAEKGATDFYSRTDTVYPNQLLSSLLYSRRDSVRASVELYYTTKVINRFCLQTNEEGLRNIVGHLVGNAVKFTTEGYVELHCELSPSQGSLLISVTDTGCGIAPEEQERIFEQFFKADSFCQGIGLGLTVSKKIAQRMGGDLILDKSYSKGARFILSLPVTDGADGAATK